MKRNISDAQTCGLQWNSTDATFRTREDWDLSSVTTPSSYISYLLPPLPTHLRCFENTGTSFSMPFLTAKHKIRDGMFSALVSHPAIFKFWSLYKLDRPKLRSYLVLHETFLVVALNLRGKKLAHVTFAYRIRIQFFVYLIYNVTDGNERARVVNKDMHLTIRKRWCHSWKGWFITGKQVYTSWRAGCKRKGTTKIWQLSRSSSAER